MSRQVRKEWILDLSNPWAKPLIIGLGVGATIYLAIRLTRWLKTNGINDHNSQELAQIYHKIMNGLEGPNIVKLKATETTKINGQDYCMSVDLTEILNNKPLFDPSQKKKNPFLPPFQDGLHIMDLEPSHRIIYNKFAAIKGHVLIISKQFEQQQLKLNYNDFRQVLKVTKALDGFYFYNSGKESGGSQPHKHFQCVPSSCKSFLIFQKLQNYCKQKLYEGEKQKLIRYQSFNFQHGLVIFQKDISAQDVSQKTYNAYMQLHNKLVSTRWQKKSISYNLIGTQSFILMIPRRQQHSLADVSINALGFTGTIMTKTRAQYKTMLQHTPQQILQQITFNDGQMLQDYKNQMIE